MAWTKLMSPLSERRRFLKTFVVLLLGLGGCLYVRRKDVNIRNYIGKSDSTHSIEEDWFERNITMFQNKANAFEYIVLRKTTIEHYGDFSCHPSNTRRKCTLTFKVESLLEAIQICDAYADVCMGFVLTRDMNMHFKHQVRRLIYGRREVTFIKKAFLSKIGERITHSWKEKWRLKVTTTVLIDRVFFPWFWCEQQPLNWFSFSSD